MVFLIQSTQNRDSSALHLKMDELIQATKGAHLSLMDIEKLDEEEFQKFRDRYNQIAEDARRQLDKGESDTHIPDIDISVSKKRGYIAPSPDIPIQYHAASSLSSLSSSSSEASMASSLTSSTARVLSFSSVAFSSSRVSPRSCTAVSYPS